MHSRIPSTPAVPHPQGSPSSAPVALHLCTTAMALPWRFASGTISLVATASKSGIRMNTSLSLHQWSPAILTRSLDQLTDYEAYLKHVDRLSRPPITAHEEGRPTMARPLAGTTIYDQADCKVSRLRPRLPTRGRLDARRRSPAKTAARRGNWLQGAHKGLPPTAAP
ncbi:hypothetical protein GW17_00040982 [Ensete ventricosum]|nr:hypothetical protein GW17_00040982 [Ensete ventricosum]RZR83343.1 hypothetical protein BHM03_00009941 [Ensete ventricosum]